MEEFVLDASVLVKWFHTEGEANLQQAMELRDQYERGEISVAVPSLLFLEILNVAKKWSSADELVGLAQQLPGLGFTVSEPSLERVAHWEGRSLTSYDACYVALAEQRRVTLVTADDKITTAAPDHARALAGPGFR